MPAGDYERLMGHRQRAVEDLQKIFRRANGLAPVVTPDDLGTLKNIMPLSFPMAKFGAAGTAYFMASPLVPLEFLKLAAWYNDLWEGTKSLGTGLGRIAASPFLGAYHGTKGAISGWERGSGIWAPVHALGDAYSGLVSPVRTGVGEIYGGLKGVVGGGLSAIPGASNVGRSIMGSPVGGAIRGLDWVGTNVLPYGPEAALLLATGGLSGAASGAGAAGSGASLIARAAAAAPAAARAAAVYGGGAEAAGIAKDILPGLLGRNVPAAPTAESQTQFPDMQPLLDKLRRISRIAPATGDGVR